MIWLEELQNRKKISRIFNTYASTFPENERRDEAQFLELAENPNCYIYNIKKEENAIGYCIIWQLESCYFLEHFEVFEAFRNQKYGSEIVEILKEKFEKLVLETEPEHLSEIAKRRISFYQRNGFEIIEKKYLQPSYGEGKPKALLYLMSNFLPENLQILVEEIYLQVYEN